MGFAQNIAFSVRLPWAMHSHCAYHYRNAQNKCISVRFVKTMLKHCAIHLVFARKLAAIVLSRETKEICN